MMGILFCVAVCARLPFFLLIAFYDFYFLSMQGDKTQYYLV